MGKEKKTQNLNFDWVIALNDPGKQTEIVKFANKHHMAHTKYIIFIHASYVIIINILATIS